MTLAERVVAGDAQAAARLITLLEDGSPEALTEIDELYPHTGKAYIVGITGAPGTGKSTLTDNLVSSFRVKGKGVGVIAIDPTSALTGGAILGDRVRMQRHSTDREVFIRSLATRGWVGGLAKGIIPVPDMVLTSSYYCDMGSKTDELLHQRYGHPAVYVDGSMDSRWGEFPDYDPERVRFLGGEVNRALDKVRDILWLK